MKLIEYLNFTGFVIACLLVIATLVNREKWSLRSRGGVFMLILIGSMALSLFGNAILKGRVVPDLLTRVIDVLIFLVGPLIYHFVSFRLFHQSWQKKFWLHYIPAILYLGLVIFSTRFALLNSSVLIAIYFVSTVQLMIYALLASFQLSSYGNKRKEISSKETSLKIPRLLVAFIVLLTVVCISHFMPLIRFGNQIGFISADLSWLLIVLLILALNIVLLTDKNLPQISVEVRKGQAVLASSKEIAGQLERLKLIMSTEKLFLENDLSLSHVAEAMKISKSHLSFLLNTHLDMNFYDYVNELRIMEFVRLVEAGNHAHLTYQGIAELSGFRSKTTFYKVFKAVYDLTPKQYFDNQSRQKLLAEKLSVS